LSLTYVSSASDLLEVPTLLELLADWRVRNHARELSGMLLYSGGNIIQALEGPEPEVEAMFATISADNRHRSVIEVLRAPISERAFPDWSMGFRNLSPDLVEATEGFNPFLQQAPGAETTDVGAADSAVHRLMALFKKSMR
jgi:hypothetical protein